LPVRSARQSEAAPIVRPDRFLLHCSLHERLQLLPPPQPARQLPHAVVAVAQEERVERARERVDHAHGLSVDEEAGDLGPDVVCACVCVGVCLWAVVGTAGRSPPSFHRLVGRAV
jgi:hypothetical protein